ncbi:MAG TPA: potassium channel family protein [Candidatus Tumulicola sp.]|nr:potassium channel family protein [Candidatus Tumulicola sp.]
MAANVLCVVAGVLLVAVTLNDVFQSAIVPRAVGRHFRPSFFAWRWCWQLWPALSWRLYARDGDRRENLLAAFAPGMVLVLLVMWAGLLILGFGAIFFGLRSGITPPIRSLGGAVYFAGTSLMTIGFGDVVGRSPGTRALAIVAGGTGLGLFSIITAYLFALFGSFQTREAFVVMLGARTGTPPSGVDLLAIAGYSQTTGDFDTLLLEAQRWTAQIMESHIAYPALAYFRSSHDYQSWIGTLGTLLDASTLLMTTIEGVRNGEARIFYNLARHATQDLASHLAVGSDAVSAGIERAEFDTACNRLVHAGYALHERSSAWERFSKMRATYAPQLNALARFFDIPPLQWIGDRGPVAGPH